MSDLPPFAVTQQAHARPVSAEELEVLGKQASARWAEGKAKNLSEAVIETVKHAHLSPQQVQRVVEFANTDAYLKEFKKEGSEHKYIDFGPGQLADPSEILKDLNDGGGGSRFDDGRLGDYSLPPGEKVAMEKTASDDGALEELFSPSANEVQYPFADPMAPLVILRDKLASCHELLSDQVSGLEVMYADLANNFYGKVKRAHLDDGVELGEIVQALTEVTPSPEHMKVAFQLITPRLIREGVFDSQEKIASSLQKTASAALVNREHPLLVEFDEFCETLSKLAELRHAKNEAAYCLGGVDRLFKEAAAHPGGYYGMIGDALKNQAAPMAKELAGKAFGSGGLAEKAIGAGVGNAHHAAAAILANKVLGGRPATVLNSYMPWDSQEKQVRQAYGVGALL